jgi:hypothetical protein
VVLDIHSLTEAHRNKVIALRAARVEKVETLIRSGINDGSIARCDPKLASLFAFGVINWVYVWYRPDDANTPDRIIDEFAAFFQSGLAAKV